MIPLVFSLCLDHDAFNFLNYLPIMMILFLNYMQKYLYHYISNTKLINTPLLLHSSVKQNGALKQSDTLRGIEC